MSTLSQEQFDKAKVFLKNHSRKLERAMFEYEFESGNIDNVLTELKQYQNSDGGFGNALEPDFRCKHSSAAATAQGLQFLSELRIKEDHEMVQSAIQYLLNTFLPDKMRWETVAKEVDNAPHAPWWSYKEPTNDRLEWCNDINVNASIVGFLHEFKGLVPSDFLSHITDYALDCLDHAIEQGTVYITYVQLAERLSGDTHDKVFAKFSPFIRQASLESKDGMFGWNISNLLYVAHPPNSKYIQLAEEIMPINLDNIIEAQNDEGIWPVDFSWGQYDDEWEIAKREWAGITTLNYLELLDRFRGLSW